MSARWALSPRDHRSHALAEDAPAPEGLVIARCGHKMPASVDVAEQPVVGGAMCSDCAVQVISEPATPSFTPPPPVHGRA